MSGIFGGLGVGSGFDTKGIVRELVDAERAPRLKLLDQRQERVEARVSALSQFRAALDALGGALGQRLSEGATRARPRVSDPSILTLQPTGSDPVAPRSLEVRQLARVQTLSAAPVADRTAALLSGPASLTIRFGTVAGAGAAEGFAPSGAAALVVDLAAGATLDELARSINDAAARAGAGVQAQILSDSEGHRLVLRGGFGEAQGFTVETAEPELEGFAFRPDGSGGLSRTAASADAIVALDGVALRRPSNIISDLVPGARLVLGRAQPGTPVQVEAGVEPSELGGLVRDLAGALDELLAIGRTLAGGRDSPGALAADGTTRRVLASLQGLPVQRLVDAPAGEPASLLDIGIRSTREGRLVVDEPRLQRALADHPRAVVALVEAVSRPASFGRNGGPVATMAAALREASEGRFGEPSAFRREFSDIARQRALLDQRMERREADLTRQFGALDRAVDQSRQVRAFLQQQIDAWTKSDRR